MIQIYYHERCGHCGDIRRALEQYDVEYESHYWPPTETDTAAPDDGIFDPVLVVEDDDGDKLREVVGHGKIIDWIEEY